MAPPINTALLDALIARGLAANPPAPGTPELEGTGLPNPDPQSAPPIYGEPPGEGYIYARDPEFRQSTLIDTNPDLVRSMILRAMEVVSQNLLLPLNEEGTAKNAEGLLKMAQAYLLIDPAVDSEGVPVAGKAMAQAAQGILTAQAQPPPGTGAHGTAQKKPGEPPRVTPGAAGQAMSKMHEQLEEHLRGARGSRPTPQPRVGA